MRIKNIENFEVAVNDLPVETRKIINGYVAFEIQNGENNIQITLNPKYSSISFVITVVALAIFLLFFFINKKFKLAEQKVFQWIGTSGAIVILVVVLFLVYLKPFYKFIIGLF